MLKQSKSHHYKPAKVTTFIILSVFISLVCILLVFISLAWSLGGAESAGVIRIRMMPTFTPTGVAASQVAAPAVAEQVAAPVVAEQAAAPAPGSNSPATTSLDSSAAAVTTRRTELPTLTPTPMTNQVAGVANQPANIAALPTTQLTPPPLLSPTATSAPPGQSNPTPLPSAPNPTATLPPPPDEEELPKSKVKGWSFVGVRALIEGGDVFVAGEAINNSGVPQQEIDISGIFYDAYDRPIVDEIETLYHIPVETVPVSVRIPFELTVESSQPIYRLDLVGFSTPADSSPHEDFRFSGVSQQLEAGMYCIQGQVKNLGAPLEDYLIVLATAYNGSGEVVSFGEYAVASPELVVADQTSSFEVCIDPLGQQIARHQLKALGL